MFLTGDNDDDDTDQFVNLETFPEIKRPSPCRPPKTRIDVVLHGIDVDGVNRATKNLPRPATPPVKPSEVCNNSLSVEDFEQPPLTVDQAIKVWKKFKSSRSMRTKALLMDLFPCLRDGRVEVLKQIEKIRKAEEKAHKKAIQQAMTASREDQRHQQAEQVVDRLESYSKPPDKPVDEPAKEVKPCRNKNCDKPVKRGFLYCGKCLPLARKRAAKRAKEDPKNVYVAPRICEIKDRHIFTPVSDMSPSNFDRYDEESDAQIYGPKEKAKRR